MRPDNFGELRSLVHGPICAAAWDTILKQVRLWRGPVAEDVLLPYMVHHLDLRWSDSMRIMPRDWAKLALRGQGWPAMQLCATLDLTRIGFNAHQLQALTACKHIIHITHLDLTDNRFDPRCADALLALPCLHKLRRLSFRSNQDYAIMFSGLKRLSTRLGPDSEANERIIVDTLDATLPLGEYIRDMS